MNKPLPKKPKTFEEFYKIKQKHAKHLTKTYQKQLKKKVRLSVKFDNLAEAKKRGKIKYVLDIRTNTLHIERIIDTDWNDALEMLKDWKNIVSTKQYGNHIDFMKGRDVPKVFITRVNQIKSAFGQKLKIQPVNEDHPDNCYAPREHSVYLQPRIISDLQKGDLNVIDKITHELDHALRVGPIQDPPYGYNEEYGRLRSEIFSFHAQMMTAVNLFKTGSVPNITLKSVLIFNTYVPTYSNNKLTVLDFFKAVYNDKLSSTGKILLNELVIFFRYVQRSGGTTKKTKQSFIKSLDYGKVQRVAAKIPNAATIHAEYILLKDLDIYL